MALKVFVANLKEWKAWLRQNHIQKTGVWVRYYKQSSGKSDLTYQLLRDEAICWGWIDSIVGKVDEEKTKIYVAPRKPKSNWSAVNKKVVEQLMKEGRLQPPGLAMIALAKSTGTWDALNEVEANVIPEDLKKELQRYTKAILYFEAFPRSTKRGILEWILNAKKPETRAARIAQTARLAQDNIRANQPRQPKSSAKI